MAAANPRVKNLKGTADNAASCCGTWIAHWRKNTGSGRTTCAAKGCSQDADVGAHVQRKHGNAAAAWYIVPLCRGCNSSWNNDEFRLKAGVKLVSARPDLCNASS
jgi:hypothetical protein